MLTYAAGKSVISNIASFLSVTAVCSRMLTYAHVCSRMLTYAAGKSAISNIASFLSLAAKAHGRASADLAALSALADLRSTSILA